MIFHDSKGFIDVSKYVEDDCTITFQNETYKCKSFDERLIYVEDEYEGEPRTRAIARTSITTVTNEHENGSITVSAWNIRYRNKSGDFHRIDGPAIIHRDPQIQQYWIDGVKYSKDHWQLVVFTLYKQAQNG